MTFLNTFLVDFLWDFPWLEMIPKKSCPTVGGCESCTSNLGWLKHVETLLRMGCLPPFSTGDSDFAGASTVCSGWSYASGWQEGETQSFHVLLLGNLQRARLITWWPPVKKKLAGRKTSNNICIQISNMNRKKPIIKNEMQHLGLKITSICHHQPVDIELKERSGNDGFAECVPVKCPRKTGSVFFVSITAYPPTVIHWCCSCLWIPSGNLT